jgi:hypothetical protein
MASIQPLVLIDMDDPDSFGLCVFVLNTVLERVSGKSCTVPNQAMILYRKIL